MQISNGVVHLGEAKGISPPSGDDIAYTDASGTQIVVPLATVIRLYGIAQYETERAGMDWDSRCKALISG